MLNHCDGQSWGNWPQKQCSQSASTTMLMMSFRHVCHSAWVVEHVDDDDDDDNVVIIMRMMMMMIRLWLWCGLGSSATPPCLSCHVGALLQSSWERKYVSALSPELKAKEWSHEVGTNWSLFSQVFTLYLAVAFEEIVHGTLGRSKGKKNKKDK